MSNLVSLRLLMMLSRQIVPFLTPQYKILIPVSLGHSKPHTSTCPTKKPLKVCPGSGGLKKGSAAPKQINRGPICPDKIRKRGRGGSGDPTKDAKGGLVRAIEPGKVRLGLIPEEWFRFLGPITGVSGPYLLMLGLGNYLVSKEIFVMEHEYYLGLSLALVLYIFSKKLAPQVGLALDKEVDAVVHELETSRTDETNANKKIISESQLAIWRAEGQKDLIAAKKENVAVQLEAVFRERQLMVFKTVHGRMEYQARRRRAEERISHKWMVQWILRNVYKAITPEYKKLVMEIAIKELNKMADAKK